MNDAKSFHKWVGQARGHSGRFWPGMFLALVIVFILAGCSQNNNAEPAGNEQANMEPVTSAVEEAEEVATPEGAMPQLVVSIWGGTLAENFQRYVAEPFEEQYGVEIILDTGTSAERTSKLLATMDNPEIDVFYISSAGAITARDAGAILPIRPENFSNLPDLYEEMRDPVGENTGPAYTFLVAGLVYNREYWGDNPPTSWLDFWNTDEPVGIPDITNSSGPLFLTMISQLNGGSEGNLDPAFEKIKELKDRMQIFTSGPDVVQAAAQGNVVLGAQYAQYVQVDPDSPVVWLAPEEGAIGNLDLALVVNGTEHRDLAEQLINFHLAPEQQLNMAIHQGESPTNSKVVVPDDIEFNVIRTPEDFAKLNVFDDTIINEHQAEWLERWQEEILGQ
jgi:putative spermidine/putrescine transport system substrate-binding protein